MSGKWAKEFDPSSKAYYYYNVETYETTWERAPDFVEDAGADNLNVTEGMIMLRAVKRIQRTFRAKQARGELRKRRAIKKANTLDHGSCNWVATHDPHSGADYYYNVHTYETTWDPPAEWIAWDKKAHPEKYAKETKTAGNQNVSAQGGLAALGLGESSGAGNAAAGGGFGGLAGLGLGNKDVDDSFQGANKTGLEAFASRGNSDSSARTGNKYTVPETGLQGQEPGETDALVGAEKSNDGTADRSKASKAAARVSAKADKHLDNVIDKCVSKCPAKCCKPMRFPWSFEGYPLKL